MKMTAFEIAMYFFATYPVVKSPQRTAPLVDAMEPGQAFCRLECPKRNALSAMADSARNSAATRGRSRHVGLAGIRGPLREKAPQLQVIHVGPGRHYLQEDHPEEIGEASLNGSKTRKRPSGVDFSLQQLA